MMMERRWNTMSVWLGNIEISVLSATSHKTINSLHLQNCHHGDHAICSKPLGYTIFPHQEINMVPTSPPILFPISHLTHDFSYQQSYHRLITTPPSPYCTNNRAHQTIPATNITLKIITIFYKKPEHQLRLLRPQPDTKIVGLKGCRP